MLRLSLLGAEWDLWWFIIRGSRMAMVVQCGVVRHNCFSNVSQSAILIFDQLGQSQTVFPFPLAYRAVPHVPRFLFDWLFERMATKCGECSVIL